MSFQKLCVYVIFKKSFKNKLIFPEICLLPSLGPSAHRSLSHLKIRTKVRTSQWRCNVICIFNWFCLHSHMSSRLRIRCFTCEFRGWEIGGSVLQLAVSNPKKKTRLPRNGQIETPMLCWHSLRYMEHLCCAQCTSTVSLLRNTKMCKRVTVETMGVRRTMPARMRELDYYVIIFFLHRQQR